MSQTNDRISKITIRNRPGTEGKISTGANTQVMMDGVPVKGVTFLKIECKAAKITKVMMEMYAEVDAEVYKDLSKGEPKYKGFKSLTDSKCYAVYNVGEPAPTAIVETEE